MILCKDCKHLKRRKVGYVSWNFKCRVTNFGVDPFFGKVHPKCPLKINKKRG